MGLFTNKNKSNFTQKDISKMLDNQKKQAEIDKNHVEKYHAKTMDGKNVSNMGMLKIFKQKYITPKKSIVNMTAIDKKKLDLLFMREKEAYRKSKLTRRHDR